MSLNRLYTSHSFLNAPAAARQLHHRLHHTYRFRPLLAAIINPKNEIHLKPRLRPQASFLRHRQRPPRAQPLLPATTPLSSSRKLSTQASKMASVKKRRPETYEEALRRLSLLQSNKTIVNLFGDQNTAAPTNKTQDLNALAMPEMLAWLSRAGYTPSSLTASGLRCVHVAGTKGKGSVSTLISSVLTEYTDSTFSAVGLYTSPHVVSVLERIQLNGEPISQEKFTIYFFELWDRLSEAARQAGDLLPSTGSIQSSTSASPDEQSVTGEEDEDAYDGPQTKPFYFRFLTLLAFHVFVREGVKSAVIECGIGGEYDPTNILEAECVTASVITQLGIDHVSMLGDTVPKIAWHKGGILKKGVKGFTRNLGQSQSRDGQNVMEVLRQRADEKGATLEVVDDNDVESWWGGQVGREVAREARLQGPFQKYNMALAAKAAREHLLRIGVPLDSEQSLFAREGKLEELPEKFVSGLKKASLRGRCEVLKEENIEWFVDGAHTEDSLRGVGEWFAGKVRSSDGEDEVWILLFNQQDRDPGVLVRSLLAGVGADEKRPVFTHAIFTRNEEFAPSLEEGPRDLLVQEKTQTAFQQVVGSGEEAGVRVEMWTEEAVGPSLELVRKIIAQKGKEGKARGKVLVTGSFHLVGAVLNNITRES
ncbi:folC protein [Naviculisporaceae sp. PSN 640]